MTITGRRTANGNQLEDVAPEHIGDTPPDDTFIWVDVVRPDADDLQVLRDRLSLPPLVLEDIGPDQQTVTFRHFGDHVFVIFYALAHDGAEITRYRVAIYATLDHLISIRQDDLPMMGDLEDRWRQDVADIGMNRPATLLYSMLDVMVDSYYPVLDKIADRVEDIEDRILDGHEAGIQREIVELRRSLLLTRRIMTAERESLVHMFRKDHPLIDSRVLPYFQDLYDQVNRATETIDSAREMLASTMDAYLSQVNNELNVVVRRLTSWTIILMVVTLVAGIYGMNFTYMPELDWRFGYPFALGLMLVLVTGMWLIFRRIRWL